MVLSARLEIKQSQKLMMNPQMQQAIQLLQLTNVQLTDLLKQEMEKNPFLAFDEAHFRQAQGHGSRANNHQATDGKALDGKALAEPPMGGTGDDEGRMIDRLPADGPGLDEYLLSQIRLEIDNPLDQQHGATLVGWIDADGYLRDTDTVLCAAVGINSDALHRLINQLQQLSPAGIFARDLADCLRLQLRSDKRLTPTHQAILTRLDLVGQHDFEALSSHCGVTMDELRLHLRDIQALDPRPAAHHQARAPLIHPPDIVVHWYEGGHENGHEKGPEGGRKEHWQAYLNEATLPKVLVLERDWEEMASRAMTTTEKKFMKSNVQSARWLRKAAQQRAATMLRVARAIVQHQQAFFDAGMLGLKPMRMKDVADQLVLHESTISRVVAGKLVQTPSGMLALKDLFSTALAGPFSGSLAGSTARSRNRSRNRSRADHQQVTSAASIKARIARLVDGETPAAVLSDDAIVAALLEEGVCVARRTVAKYRAYLNIPASPVRRRTARLKM